MKIKLLRVTNLKKVKHVEIAPEDNVIVIAGKNESGKTSVLDAILWAMTGKMGMKGISKPIREGEEEAEVVLEIDKFVVRRYWKDNERSYLTVTNKDDNIQYKSPQSMLDNFMGKLTFDPLHFSQLDNKQQRDLILEVTGLKKDLNDIDKKKKHHYDLRTIVNRNIKEHEAQLKGMEKPEKDLPKNYINISGLLKELEHATDWNYHIAIEKEELGGIIDKILNYKEEIDKLEKQSKILSAGLNEKKQKDIDAIKEKIEKAQKINEELRKAAMFRTTEETIKNRKKHSEELTKRIKILDKDKIKLLKTQKMPISGLSCTDEGVMYSNIPFTQLASSEQLKVSISMAMAMNPKLRVIRITDGSLLDDDNMKVIEEMAKKFDYQIWLERVAVDKFADIVLVDGEIKNRNYKVRS